MVLGLYGFKDFFACAMLFAFTNLIAFVKGFKASEAITLFAGYIQLSNVFNEPSIFGR